jgi:hypothetical protein
LWFKEKGGIKMPDPTVGEVVEAYFKTEDKIKRITAKAEKMLAPLEKFQTARKAFCGKLLTEQQGQNIKTAAGTAFFKKQEFVNVADWDAFVEKELLARLVPALCKSTGVDESEEKLLQILKDSFPYELLTKAVNKMAVLEIMGENRENVPPAGINYVSKQVVQIHRK